MGAELTTKTCRMCGMEIPAQARKCPHCHHFQNRLSMVMFHPAFAVLFAAIPLAVVLAIFANVLDEGQDFQTYASQIEIAGSSELAFGDTKSGPTVAVIGIITNTSPVPWKEIKFHVDFFDAQGRRADVGLKEEYGYYLPAKAATSFKVSFRREFPETNYVKYNVRVLTAKDARSRW
jgi:hypothetical protein